MASDGFSCILGFQKDWTAAGTQGQLRSGLFSESKCRTARLESVASKTNHDQHVIHVFKHAHRPFLIKRIFYYYTSHDFPM